jgi:hypothetical protein
LTCCEQGGITLLVINTNRDTAKTLTVSSASERYTMTAPLLEDTRVDLNGKELKLGADDSLPELSGTPAPSGSVGLPPASITFLAVREAPSIVFPFHPFANIRGAVLKLHAIRLAKHEKPHYLAIDYADVFQIENDLAQVRLGFEQFRQLGDRLFLDPAAKDENGESPSHRGLNPERHQSSRFTGITFTAQ